MDVNVYKQYRRLSALMDREKSGRIGRKRDLHARLLEMARKRRCEPPHPGPSTDVCMEVAKKVAFGTDEDRQRQLEYFSAMLRGQLHEAKSANDDGFINREAAEALVDAVGDALGIDTATCATSRFENAVTAVIEILRQEVSR
jgi:hypothetical protein